MKLIERKQNKTKGNYIALFSYPSSAPISSPDSCPCTEVKDSGFVSAF